MAITFEEYSFPAAVEGGTLKTFDTVMHPYADERPRTIRVWLPEEYDGVKRFPVIYLHDAQNLFRGADERPKWDCDRAITALKSEGINCILVGIDTNLPTRFSELQPPYKQETEHPLGSSGGGRGIIPPPASGDTYAEFVVKYLKPMIDAELMTLADAENTCIAGASMGGLQSYYMAMEYPEVFGRALCFSPAFPVFELSDVISRIDAYDMAKLEKSRFFFYNGGQSLDREITAPTLAVYLRLEERGLDSLRNAFLYDSREPHYETAWAKYFPEAVRFLFSKDNSVPFPPAPPARKPADAK